ncbi:MAG TPA: DUF5671 domain-containing protein [Ktedonobacterales bacterium]|jgi:hypothetical protein
MRQVYRIYLYVVSLALVVFAAVGLGALLDVLLAFTPLHGSVRMAPSSAEVTQQLVFAFVAWVVAVPLGVLHYRLMWRDIARYPEAGSGALRAFFLNLGEAVATMLAVVVGIDAFTMLANQQPGVTPETASAFATALAGLAVAALLHLERARTGAAPGLSTTFQRLHLYGVPFGILLLGLAGAWDSAMKATLDAVLVAAKLYNPVDPRACGPFLKAPVEGICSLPNAGLLWLAVLVPLAAIACYAFAVRTDGRSLLRSIAHLGSVGVGIAFALVGVDRALELALRALFGLPVQWSEVAHPWQAPYNFVSPLTFGVLVLVIYGLWVRAESAQLALGGSRVGACMEAVAGVLLAIPLFWGLGRALDAAFESWAGAAASTLRSEWTAALGLILTGLGAIVLHLRLRARSQTDPGAHVPWRASVLALLAGGVVTGAGGLAVALYAWGTALLGAPLTNWEQTARAGAAALVVGVLLTGVYGAIALRGRFIEPLMASINAATSAAASASSPTTAPSRDAPDSGVLVEAIEQTLDDYATHEVSREKAAQRILELTHAQ